MRRFEKTIITCAITGGDHVPSQSPHLPITPDELIGEGIGAAEAGASIIHLHVRDPDTGQPSSDIDLFEKVAEGIAAETDAIILPTTGGAIDMSLEERLAVIPKLAPEMATCNMGTLNFSLVSILDSIEEFQFEWEPEFLEASREGILKNTYGDIEQTLELLANSNTKPELECYDMGHLYTIKHFDERGYLTDPLKIQFVMGVQGGISANPENLVALVQTADKLFGDRYSFSVVGAGKWQFRLGSQAVCMGGHPRVGMEDNLYLRKGKLASSNIEMVEKMVSLNRELTGRDIASPAETREFLGISEAVAG